MSYENLSTHELLLSFKKGDADAFDALHTRYAEKFYRKAKKGSLSHEEAEDAVQNTFVRIVEKRSTYDESKRGGARWVWPIHTHAVIDLIRERERLRGPQPPPPGVTEIEDPDEEAKREVREWCQNVAWNRISEKDRDEIRRRDEQLREGKARRPSNAWRTAAHRFGEAYYQCLEDNL